MTAPTRVRIVAGAQGGLAMADYPDFLDSTDLIADGPALRDRLRRDGYLFIRGLLPAETIATVRRRLLRQAAAGGWLDPDSPVEAGIANQQAACKDPEERYMQVFRHLWCDEALHRLRTHPTVLALFTRIFGEPALAHPMFVQRNIFPQADGFDFTTGEHQDRVHIGGATSYALWMPLGDCPREKGALAVAAGSHRGGILPTKVGSGAGGMDIAVPIPGTWVTGGFRAGDALIFQDVTVHKALPNRSREIRMSFDARYQPASQPIADTNMVPYAGCGSWEDGLCWLGVHRRPVLLAGPATGGGAAGPQPLREAGRHGVRHGRTRGPRRARRDPAHHPARPATRPSGPGRNACWSGWMPAEPPASLPTPGWWRGWLPADAEIGALT